MSPTPSRNPPRRRPPRANDAAPDPATQTPPPPSPSPSPSASGAATRSGTSSADSSAEFVTDPGPAFDPRSAPAAPEVDEEAALPLEEWDEQRIREFLTLQGEVTHAMLRVGPEDLETWLQTERDLNSIAPPLTRILNRYDVTRAAAVAGDEILLATAIGRYGLSNYSKRRRLLAARAEQGPQPVTGVPAEPETGPEHDEEWQRVHEAPPALVPKGARR